MPDEPSKLKPAPFEVVEFSPTDDIQLTQAATVLFEAMKPITTSYPTMDAALGEIIEISKIPGGVVLIAVDFAGEIRGIVGGRPMYPGNVMELHPLAVDPKCHRMGIGRMLVRALEEAAMKMGYSVILLGADDEAGQSSLAGADLFPRPVEKLVNLSYPGGHQGGFYEKVGYSVSGVVPDANGFGKPDIWYAKRICREKSQK